MIGFNKRIHLRYNKKGNLKYLSFCCENGGNLMFFKKTITIITIIMFIFLFGCSNKKDSDPLVENQTIVFKDQPIVVRVGNVAYYLDEVQRDIDMLLEDYDLIGQPLSDEDKEKAVQEIVDGYVVRALSKAQLEKLGLNDIDDNMLYSLRKLAQENYEAYWQQFRDTNSSKNYSDDQITAYLEENGLNIDYFFETVLSQYEMQKIMDYYKLKVEVSDEEIDSFYEENYIKPSRERYKDNISLFEEEVVYGEYDSAYTPDGFRIIHQIVIPVPDDLKTKLEEVEKEANDVAKEAEDAYNKIANLAIEGKDSKEETKKYQAAMNKINELNVEYGKLWKDVSTSCEDECDEIYARIQGGESFDDLMALFNPNDILIYHPLSEKWPSELMSGANTLKEKGDISQPTLCSDGVHILYYYDDVPSGDMKLENKDDREKLRSILCEQYTLDKLRDLSKNWEKELGLIVDMSMLKY